MSTKKDTTRRVRFGGRAAIFGFVGAMLLAPIGCHTPRAVQEEPVPTPSEAGTPRPVEPLPEPVPVRGGAATIDLHTLGYSVEGRPIEARVMGRGSETVMILATIHGDEPAGTPLLGELEHVLAGSPELIRDKTVVLIPVANPDGYANKSRGNVNGVDLNRNFPAANFSAKGRHGDKPLSEPESRAIHDAIVRFSPDRIVSVHQPLACVDWDGPAEDLARAMSEAGDLPLRKLGGRDGSLGSFVSGNLATPIITLELRGGDQRRSTADLWRRYGRTLLAAITYPDPAPGDEGS